jgi:hypothetical protein
VENIKKGQLSEAEIAELKAKHGVVYELTVDDAVCYLRKPKRQELSAATAIAQNDPLLFNEQLLNDCWLGGADCIKTDDDYFLAAGGQLTSLLEVKQAELKKI